VGCPDEAANDIATILRLGRALKQETLSIPVMTAQATDRIAVSCIWEGIVRHEWTQSSLDQFRSEITESENVTAFRRAYIFESLIWLRVMDSVLKSESPTWGWPPYSKNDHPARPRTESAFWYRPATDAIIRLALLRLADRTAEFAGVATLKAGAFDRARFDEWQATVSANLKRTPSMALAHYDGRAIEVPLMRTLMVASALRFARLACTLEADHLKQFRYPVVLPSDNPDAIDIISGRQVSYETTPDGQSFQLKSVGWTPSDKNAFKEDALDWLHDWAWASPQMVGRN
jgi:hypothetical protein